MNAQTRARRRACSKGGTVAENRPRSPARALVPIGALSLPGPAPYARAASRRPVHAHTDLHAGSARAQTQTRTRAPARLGADARARVPVEALTISEGHGAGWRRRGRGRGLSARPSTTSPYPSSSFKKRALPSCMRARGVRQGSEGRGERESHPHCGDLLLPVLGFVLCVTTARGGGGGAESV